MKRTLNEIARNKFDEAAADRRHRENPHKVREVSAAFAENRPPRFEARATLSGSQQRRAPELELVRPRHAVWCYPYAFCNCAAQRLQLSPEDAGQKIRLPVASVWSVIVESEIVCK